MFNEKGKILILLAIFCIAITISSASANDTGNLTLDASNSNDEINNVEQLNNVEEKELNDCSEELNGYENENLLQSSENEDIHSSINETKIGSSSNDKLESSTWSGEDTETFYLRLISTDYVNADSSQQIMVQSIKTSGEPFSRNAYYTVINSAGNIVYNFRFDIYPNQIVYFESNLNVFKNLPAGTYKCAVSEDPINDLDTYNKIPGYYAIKWNVVKKASTSTSTPVKTTIILKTLKIKKSAKKLILQATLKKGKSPLKSKKIIFKFNGKKYTAKTNKKGIAKFTIKKNILKKLKVGKKVKYQASYGKITVKKTAKVKK